MGKTIVWSDEAKSDLISIKAFFDNRNKSAVYSTKLLKQLKRAARLIEKHPNVGIDTSLFGRQGLIVHNYILLYRQIENHILIITVWDCRRNPDHLFNILIR